MNVGSSDMLRVTGIGAKLSGLLRSALIQMVLQASLDPIGFSVSIHALDCKVLSTVKN